LFNGSEDEDEFEFDDQFPAGKYDPVSIFHSSNLPRDRPVSAGRAIPKISFWVKISARPEI